MKYLIYCRKSTDTEDRQVLSLESQENELKRLADSLNLTVVGVLKESMSAKSPGRPVFQELLQKISSGDADSILCWKLDRLARNPIDGGNVQWLLQQSKIKQIKTIDREYLPKDNVLMMSVEFGMSNQYIRDLSENVKRGNREKLRRGEWPNHAPYGYINETATKSVKPDPEKSLWVVRMFELYSSGQYGFRQIVDILYEQGLRTSSGRKVLKSTVQRIIPNPFYYGVMVREGVHYQGKYKPLISKELFDKAQEVLNQSSRPKQKVLFFPLRGPMRCNKCGCMLTASLKKGFRYYYCTNGKGSCDQGRSYMREEYISKKVAEKFDDLHFDEELIELMYESSKEKLGLDDDRYVVLVKNLEGELESVSQRESRLTDGFASGSIRTDLYETKMTELNNQRVDLERQLSGAKQKSSVNKSTLERTKEVFLESSRAKREFVEADDNKKHAIVNRLLWNVWFEDKEIAQLKYKGAYAIISDTHKDADLNTLLPD